MSKAEFTQLNGGRILLRRFRDADLLPFLAYRNDPEVARYQSWESLSVQEGSAFVEEQQALQLGSPGQWFQFAIEIEASGLLAGDCALKVSEQERREAEIGFTLSRD